MIVEIILATLLVVGAAFAFIGSLGLVKLPDFYMRLHGPTKSTTLGIGCILGGSILYMATTQDAFTFNEFLITLFLFITAPVSAHLASKAALHSGVEDITGQAVMKTALARAAEADDDIDPSEVVDDVDESIDPLEENLDAMVDDDSE